MQSPGLILKVILAFIGCVAGSYVGDELLGGGALGWMAGGAIIAGCVYPLFKTLLAWREERRRSGNG
ncbi:MAG TPA: hypothetical protein VGM46_01115 [Mesorhizobium sp.]|jgi:hypothetical protein